MKIEVFEMKDGKMISTGTTEINTSITDEELEEYGKLFCDCEEQCEPDEAVYVEGHLGVDHGWICPHCEKFVQIG